MEVLEVTTRGLSRDNARDAQEVVREHASRLDSMFPDLISCRVAVERRHRRHTRSGNDHRVRVTVTLTPSHELVAVQEPDYTDSGDSLVHVIRSAFHAIERRIKDQRAVRRGDVKSHEMELGIVVRIFPDRGYGFLRSVRYGHEVFFHRNSLLHAELDQLCAGTQVRFVEEAGEQGPQASTVQVVESSTSG